MNINDWLLLSFVIILVVVVSVYRHYKGDEESFCGYDEDDCGTTYYDDVTNLVVRPEIIEMCKVDNWTYGYDHLTYHPVNWNEYELELFRLCKNRDGDWKVNKGIMDFATDDEIEYIEQVVGITHRKVLAFEKMKSGFNVQVH
jgi:hypothetical protein